MTQKLYLDDSYLCEFHSSVIERTDVNGRPGVILDRTIFYPTSGGQPHDTGEINDSSVIDVFEDQHHRIVHLLKTPFSGVRIEGRLNWTRRFDHMQQHTGQHMLSQAFLKICKADTISFHLGKKSATIDLNESGFGKEKISSVETLVNQIIYENRPIDSHIVSKDKLNQFPLRNIPTTELSIRVIEINNFDFTPCGGTHCSQTGEVGILKIDRYENYKGGTRVHFVCGFRAFEDYQKKSEILKQVCNSISIGESDLNRSIQKTIDDLKSLRWEHDKLKKQVLEYEAQTLLSERHKFGEFNIIKKIFINRDRKDIKILAEKALKVFPETIILFGTKTGGKAALLFLRSEELSYDMQQLMQIACMSINGQGGGHPQSAQGGGPKVEKLEEALQRAVDAIKKAPHQ